jgi:hypothetical protein
MISFLCLISHLWILATPALEAWVKLNTLALHGVIAKGNANTDRLMNHAIEITPANVAECIPGNGTSHVALLEHRNNPRSVSSSGLHLEWNDVVSLCRWYT